MLALLALRRLKQKCFVLQFGQLILRVEEY